MSGSDAPTLRKYQTDMLAAICGVAGMRQLLDTPPGRAMELPGLNRILCKAPTGTGKTVTFAAMLEWLELKLWLGTFPEGDRKMLVVAHREELLDQAADKIRRQNPGLMVSIEQGDRHASVYSDVIIASVQTLTAMKCRRLKRLLTRLTFRLVIVDEAHHAAAASYRTMLVHLGFLPPADATDTENLEAANEDDVAEMTKNLEAWDTRAPKDRLLVGVTATPNRSDAIGLGCVFQTIAYSYALKDAINDKWLVPIVPWVVESKTNLDGVRTSHGDFNQKDLAEAVNNEARNAEAVAAWQEYAEGESTLAFTVDVAHAHELAETFRGAGVRAEALSGETPKDQRREMLAAYTRGDIQVITNCMVLTEGTDLPRTGCILHAKPTKSATLYEQMTGRGLRIHPGKTECIVIDVVDIARRHSLQTAPVLYGLPPGLLAKGQTLEALEDQLAELLAKYPGLNDRLKEGRFTLDQLGAIASTFDIWAIPSLDAFGAGRALNWMKVGEDVFRLQYPWVDSQGLEGNETVTVAKDILGHWDVALTWREKVPPASAPGQRTKPGIVRQRTIAAGIESSDAAAGLAEAFVLAERRNVTRLADKSAPWRAKPASGKQLGALRAMRVPYANGITSGEASNLIDLAKARKGR